MAEEGVPKYNVLIACMSDALKGWVSEFGNWENVEKGSRKKH